MEPKALLSDPPNIREMLILEFTNSYSLKSTELEDFLPSFLSRFYDYWQNKDDRNHYFRGITPYTVAECFYSVLNRCGTHQYCRIVQELLASSRARHYGCPPLYWGIIMAVLSSAPHAQKLDYVNRLENTKHSCLTYLDENIIEWYMFSLRHIRGADDWLSYMLKLSPSWEEQNLAPSDYGPWGLQSHSRLLGPVLKWTELRVVQFPSRNTEEPVQLDNPERALRLLQQLKAETIKLHGNTPANLDETLHKPARSLLYSLIQISGNSPYLNGVFDE